MIYTGGFFAGESFVTAFSNCDASVGLMLGSFIAFIITIVYYLIRRVLKWNECMSSIPEGFKAKAGAKIMSLIEPTKKMSKSDENENAYILLIDDEDTIRRKIKRSVTDSVGIVQYSDEQPGIKNLLNIYSKLSDKSIDEIVTMYEGKGYGDFKADVAEVIVEALRPIRERYEEILKDKEYLESVYAKGAQRAEAQARKTLRKVYKKVGLIEKKFI